MSTERHFPEDWQRAVILVAHPDDVEYGLAGAVHRWTSAGKDVRYILASSGEAGIEGMPPEQAGPLREDEQRRAGARVGVTDIAFLGLPDSNLADDAATRQAVLAAVIERRPDIAIVGYFGPAWGPDAPNHPDHMNFGAAVVEALADTRIRLYEQNGDGELIVDVDGYQDAAIDSLAEHRVYLEVLDPDTDVREQARKQVEMSAPARDLLDGRPGVSLRQLDAGSATN